MDVQTVPDTNISLEFGRAIDLAAIDGTFGNRLSILSDDTSTQASIMLHALPNGRYNVLKVAHRSHSELIKKEFMYMKHFNVIPCIAEVIEQFRTPRGLEGFIMPHYESDLFHQIRENRLSPMQKASIFAGLCNAVYHLHNLDFVHCDIKPENILMTDRMEPKLSDFGMAMPCHELAGAKGSKAYLSVELYIRTLTNTNATPQEWLAADVFALGMTLYVLIFGNSLHLDMPRVEDIQHGNSDVQAELIIRSILHRCRVVNTIQCEAPNPVVENILSSFLSLDMNYRISREVREAIPPIIVNSNFQFVNNRSVMHGIRRLQFHVTKSEYKVSAVGHLNWIFHHWAHKKHIHVTIMARPDFKLILSFKFSNQEDLERQLLAEMRARELNWEHVQWNQFEHPHRALEILPEYITNVIARNGGLNGGPVT